MGGKLQHYLFNFCVRREAHANNVVEIIIKVLNYSILNERTMQLFKINNAVKSHCLNIVILIIVQPNEKPSVVVLFDVIRMYFPLKFLAIKSFVFNQQRRFVDYGIK